MSQSLSITPFTSDDLPVLAGFLHTAKLNLAINRLLIREWPNEVPQKANCTNAIQGSLNDPDSECLKAVDTATGDILGFAVLTRKRPQAQPQDAGEGDSDAPKSQCPDFMNPTVFNSVMQAASELGKVVQGVDHFDITYIYVKPSHRRTGIASKLLDTFKERCKAESLPLCIQIEPAGYRFFISQGFEDNGHHDFDLAQWAEPNSGLGVFRLAAAKWVPK
ncbi:hypothetical protein F5X68DRAFT_73084 [Plectosphaerella plurivora]|uniref:N-acetyltransferase domain-containing protein n=1 Tax=Plectosphaerella plurivora TaxID=936078 RepID=A0A9P9ACF9_9PEZI|nr:hypothetical protein F5X68DRAFT_73084 [Plectosphaerella plurivora]